MTFRGSYLEDPASIVMEVCVGTGTSVTSVLVTVYDVVKTCEFEMYMEYE